MEGYRPGPGLPTKQRAVKSFGYLEDQTDPEAFMAEVKEFNANYRAQNVPLRIEAEGTARMYSQENRKQNYGYRFLGAVYNMLHIDSFIQEKVTASKFHGNYSPSEIFKFLVLTRCLSPDSKRASCQMKDNFYGMQTDFTLPDIYRSLDLFASTRYE